jgi:primase-polymerase (primpol)-like protein
MSIPMSPTEIPAPEQTESAPIIPSEIIPEDLKRFAQWVCWRSEDRGPGKKPDKRPVNPHDLRSAGVIWSNTSSNFPHTYMVYVMYRPRGIKGIGFVLTAGYPFVGLDLDHCLEDGQPLPWAQAILEQVPSYTEISPSGMGCASWSTLRTSPRIAVVVTWRYTAAHGS